MKRTNTQQFQHPLQSNNPWDEIHVAYGLGVYDPAVDKKIDSVIKRADQNMFQKKKAMKGQAGR